VRARYTASEDSALNEKERKREREKERERERETVASRLTYL